MDNHPINDTHSNLDVKGVKSLIFDIGGLILDDSGENLQPKLNLSEQRKGELETILYNDPRWYEVMTGRMRCEDYMHALIREHPNFAHELELSLGMRYFAESMPLHQPNINLLKSLHETGKYQMYWLSNMQDTEYQFLERQGILDLLDGGAYSCIEHCKKPELEFYQALFERYQLNPCECVFFDDKARNLDAGEQLGMRGELVPKISALERILKKYIK